MGWAGWVGTTEASCVYSTVPTYSPIRTLLLPFPSAILLSTTTTASDVAPLDGDPRRETPLPPNPHSRLFTHAASVASSRRRFFSAAWLFAWLVGSFLHSSGARARLVFLAQAQCFENRTRVSRGTARCSLARPLTYINRFVEETCTSTLTTACYCRSCCYSCYDTAKATTTR